MADVRELLRDRERLREDAAAQFARWDEEAAVNAADPEMESLAERWSVPPVPAALFHHRGELAPYDRHRLAVDYQA